MSGFTKGTWRADDTGGGNFSIVALRENYVVELGHIDDPHDAMLIAAAPELLEALQSIDAQLRVAWDEGRLPWNVIDTETMRATKAALNKALGQ